MTDLVEIGAKQLYKDYENTTDEHVERVFASDADPMHKDLADEMREWFKSALAASGLLDRIETLEAEITRLRDKLRLKIVPAKPVTFEPDE